jgi:hypothetical protein
MNVTYSWNFWQFSAYPEIDGYTDVVFQVNYNYIGTSDVPKPDGGFYSASWGGSQAFQYQEGTPFVPFNELTPEIVTGWMEATISPEQFAKMQANIVSNIQDAITPQVVNLPAPWTPQPTPPVSTDIPLVPVVPPVSPTSQE